MTDTIQNHECPHDYPCEVCNDYKESIGWDLAFDQVNEEQEVL